MRNSLLWGRFTWALFHTIADKMKTEHEISLTKEIKVIILSICSNLPCPICRQHAINFLNRSVEFKNVTKKDELKIFLFHFHNEVNKITKKKQADLSILSIYSNLDLRFIMKEWAKYYKIFKVPPSQVREESNRVNVRINVLNYLNTNMYKFV